MSPELICLANLRQFYNLKSIKMNIWKIISEFFMKYALKTVFTSSYVLRCQWPQKYHEKTSYFLYLKLRNVVHEILNCDF